MNVFKSFKNLGSDWFRNTVADPDHFGTYLNVSIRCTYRNYSNVYFSHFLGFFCLKKLEGFTHMIFYINQLVIITNL